ncbi:MAG: fused DSP-PTPase phosphatase/NAD kinase-like protein [Hyphomicrobiaceae bacterium]
MAGFAKQTKRAVRRVTNSWRTGLASNSPQWARTLFGPTVAYLDMLFVDHGIFRILYLNKHKLSSNAWRSAQPTPYQIRKLARQGVRTIVNLRGERECGSYWHETQACKKAGIKLVNYRVRSRAAPEPAEILGARDLFADLEYPILLHCKSGADRAGLMSVLFRHFHEGAPIDEARKELSFKYGHIRQADTGVLDYFFERYLADNEKSAISFVDWLSTHYDPDEVKATFMAKGWANRIVNSILRRE